MATPVRAERVEDAARGALRGDGAASGFHAGSGGGIVATDLRGKQLAAAVADALQTGR